MQSPSRKPDGSASRVIRLDLPVTRPRLTFIILGLLVAVFLVQITIWFQQDATAVDPVSAWSAVNSQRILENGEIYRLLTSVFVHLSENTLFLNALALFFVGQSVEAFFGRQRFAILFLLGGLSGSLASFMFTRQPSSGAAGAVFALFGANLVFLWFNRALLGRRAMVQFQWVFLMAALNVIFAVMGDNMLGAPISLWTYVGGFFAGVVMGWFMSPVYQARPVPRDTDIFQVIDTNPLKTAWRAPIIYAGAMIAAFAYAFFTLR